QRAVLQDAFTGLEAKVKAIELGVALFELVDNSQALQVVLEASGIRRELFHTVVQLILPCMPERRVPQVVSQGDRFNQVFMQVQVARQRASNLRYLDAMR